MHIQALARFRQALTQSEFILFCQAIKPVKDNDSITWPFFEIFVRLREEEERLILPGTFIPLLESLHLMPGLDRWVTSQVIKWSHASGIGGRDRQPHLYAINVSSVSIIDPSFPGFVRAELEALGVLPQTLCFEFPATMAASKFDIVDRFANDLRQLGCMLTLQDYATEVLPLAKLISLPLNFVKIDGDLIRDAHLNQHSYRKIAHINESCRTVGVYTIGEFVENRESLKSLQKLGVNFVQGFGVATPQPLGKVK
jgi:EAL domain-containing protein (putative c-di-GMP-specific phosphodiesterase class I)